MRKATSGHALEPKEKHTILFYMAMMAYTLNLLMIWAAGGHWVTGGVTGIAGSAVALQAALR